MKMTIAKIILGSSLKKPATRRYPAEVREPFPGTRGRITMNINACNLCTLCARKCPTQAITVDRKEKFWQIDRWRCILCGACVSACPQKAILMETHYAAPDTAKPIEIQRKPDTPSVPEPGQKS